MTKRDLEEVDARGWRHGEGLICADCVVDAALVTAIHEAAQFDDTCRFCGGSPAASLDVVTELVAEGLQHEYDGPINEAGYESREGGYQTTTWDTWDLLQEHEVSENGDVLGTISAAISTELWCHRGPYAARPNEALQWGWEAFCEYVISERRFTFSVPNTENAVAAGELELHEVPAAVSRTVIDDDLIVTLPKGGRWWRVRVDDAGRVFHSAREIGTPPNKYARDNRMTPKGIGAFYGASTLAGALDEVGYATSGTLSYGRFELISPVRVVDLRAAPPVPSLFDRGNRSRRASIQFLHWFVDHIRAPAKPDSANLSYVPTQVITEYLRYHTDPTGQPIDGVLWRSARDETVDVCALFIRNDEFIDSGASCTASDARMYLDASTIGTSPAPSPGGRRGLFAMLLGLLRHR
ncbi:HEPN-associated N-terminal domain-containing protein [Gordonia amicalis]|uniref:HEPN-associated N-terminal domain-containing protein n=1 Tax=Gordonia amicalis TaxID=89053 RepID=UPI0022A662E3|nr:HEPN-associated N-terminal domain-containing protein [Gordonia amicalis]MCZ0914940.1 HEPN-associated N-terminal domain-containing protein [Gordonia amicalis]